MKVKGMISGGAAARLDEQGRGIMGRGARGLRAAGAMAHVWRLVRKRCSKRPGFACERPKHGVYAEALTRTVTTRVAPSKGSRMALSRSVTKAFGATSSL